MSVQILDVNDNFPQFLEPLPRAIPIGRLTPPGTVLARFQAVDPDEGPHGAVTFRMESDGESGREEGGKAFVMEADGRLVLGQALAQTGQVPTGTGDRNN